MVDQQTVHYVPVLKWRQGEKIALRTLNESIKNHIIPLIELVNDEGDNPDDLSKDIAAYWSAPTYLDVHYRPKEFARRALENVAKHTERIDIIPVVRLDSPQIIIDGIKDVSAMYGNGYAIRIIVQDKLDFKLIQKEVKLIKNQLPSSGKKIDLILDFGYIDETTKYKSLLKKVAKNFKLDNYRRYIVSAGTFPPDLMDFKLNADNFLNRTELILWDESKNITGRNTIYSDYTVRYPANIEKGGRGSISIRYTIKDKFQVFRGLLNDASFKYLVHALNIKTLYGKIYPSNYCWGDASIHEKATQLESCLGAGLDPESYEFKPGNSTDWVAISVNHHMAVVLMDNLSLSKGSSTPI